MNKKIFFPIVFLSIIFLLSTLVFAQDSAPLCPEGQILYNGQCMETGSSEPPEVLYGCEKGEIWDSSSRKCVPSGASGPSPSVGSCPTGCTCTENSVSCGPQAGSAPNVIEPEGKTAPAASTGSCPLGCTCTENAISCNLEEDSEGPSANNVPSQTGSGSGKIETETIPNVQIIKNEDSFSIQVAETKASTTAEVVIKERKLYVKSEEGERQVKIMPNIASEIAVERLGDLGFTIELKETGNYELKAEKNAKLLLLFSLKAELVANVNGETGTITVKKPWWSFLASGI